MRFSDRHDAGRRLASALSRYRGNGTVVLALPRGGVPVAYEIALALAAPLDIILVRKIGAPFQPELAIGAIADGESPEIVLDDDMIATFGVPKEYLDATIERERQEIERRRRVYLAGRAPISLEGKAVVLVDDGIATGTTMIAALRAVRRRNPSSLILAVPVAAADSLARLRPEADAIVCLDAPADFLAVGQFYADFRQVEDDEVKALLDGAAGGHGP